MKIRLFALKIIFAVSLPIFLLLSTLNFVSSDMQFYRESFVENEISERTALTESELMYISKEVVNYLQGERNDFDIKLEDGSEVFGEREKLHMVDVRELFEEGFFIRNSTLFLALGSLLGILYLDKKSLGSALILSFAFPLVAVLVLGTFMAVDFDKTFTVFHLLLFDNDLWLLDPRTDVLIKMLPLNFFAKMAYRIVYLFLIEILILLAVGVVLKRLEKSN